MDVPTWVREEFQACQEPDAELDYGACVEVFEKMIANQDMARVWRSLEAQKPLICEFPRAATLAAVVATALDEFGGSERLTSRARKDVARGLAESAQKFAKCLESLKNGAGYEPDFILGRLQGRFSALIDDLQIQYSYKAFGRLNEQYGESIDELNDGVLLGIELQEALPRMMSALAEAAHEWADAAPIISRPESENASRLYLIRELTRMFRYWYGNPLRANTLAVTGVFFDCSGLSEADITKLAP